MEVPELQPLFVRRFHHGLVRPGAGVRHKDVRAAHRLGGAHDRLAAFGSSNIRGDALRPDAEVRCDLGGGLLHRALRPGSDDNVGSFPGEAARYGKPDPLASAGDDCEFSCQSEFHQFIHCPPSTLKHCETM